MKRRLILIRHGESEGNVDQEAYIHTIDPNVPLTKKGETQAKLAGTILDEILEVDNNNVFFSPYKRTQKTKELALEQVINKNLNSIKEEPLIREHEYVQDPKSVKQVRKEIEKMHSKDRFWHRFSGGESFADVDQRIALFLHINKDLEGTTILFTHGNASESLVRRLLNIPISEFPNMGHINNCDIIVLENIFGRFELNKELTTSKELIESVRKIRED